MAETFRIHFGYSKKSKYYTQAIEIANLAYKHECIGVGEDTWHIVTFTDDQADLMAYMYSIAVKLPSPKLCGVEIYRIVLYCKTGGRINHHYTSNAIAKRIQKAVHSIEQETGKTAEELSDYLYAKYVDPRAKDMARARDKLISERRIDYIDPKTQTWVRSVSKPREPVTRIQNIRDLIAGGHYVSAVDTYYAMLGDRPYGEYTRELIYLKRLGNVPLAGRDLVFFRSESSRGDLVDTNLSEYVFCIDTVLSRCATEGRSIPLQVIYQNAPTLQQVIDRHNKEHRGHILRGDSVEMGDPPMTAESLSTVFDACPEGRLFDRYPDQIRYCRYYECNEELRFEHAWATFSPAFLQSQVYDAGLTISWIEVYRHKEWRDVGRHSKPRQLQLRPDFTTLHSLSQLKSTLCAMHDYPSDWTARYRFPLAHFVYSGRRHTIEGKDFYELSVLRYTPGAYLGNPFIELVDDVLREAENMLRDRHGLPRIGEGWVSETKLFKLVQSIFPDAQPHAMPDWLMPQHLDVYIASKRLAFEYQGRQHFEPVSYFGGDSAFEATLERDKLKVKKCKANGITLIHWDYDEPITLETLTSKLSALNDNFQPSPQ
jgi:hypothetical protein